MFQMDGVDPEEDRRILSDAYARWRALRRDAIKMKKEAMAELAAIMLWERPRFRGAPHTDDIVADYSSLRALFPMGADKMIFSSDYLP